MLCVFRKELIRDIKNGDYVRCFKHPFKELMCRVKEIQIVDDEYILICDFTHNLKSYLLSGELNANDIKCIDIQNVELKLEDCLLRKCKDGLSI